ncbi:MAG TPA: 4-hydroxy-tetrahydrodipicolinate reductase [Burkholderiaceae bacterium]|nr:4-hydroxy-tetrahydrodipicolinate reductase [Burkholderiaceae bacterium]
MKLAIAGASGRMGQTLIEAALTQPDLSVSVALDRADSPMLGRDCAETMGRSTGARVTSELSALAGADVLIDFTRPDATLRHLDACVAAHVKMVIGTTGFDDASKRAIQAASQRIAIVFAPNMSVGVNATFKLVEMAASMLGEGYDIEIIEAHHQHKVDAPSGTALKMGEIVAAALGRPLAELAVYAREGHTGERRAGSIGFASIRGGDIVGDHTVMFAGAGERIEITHRSGSRSSYANGGLRAARFLADKTTGLYDMFDVLGLAR